MNKKELQSEIDKINWFHSINLPYEGDPKPGDSDSVIRTPGLVDHTNFFAATNRFGLPEDLRKKSILDVGTWDGYFAFEAERRGSKSVIAIDDYAGCSNIEQSAAGFRLAKKVLNSNVGLVALTLDKFYDCNMYFRPDIVFYFGVLYHVADPLVQLKKVANLAGEYALIETAVSTRRWFSGNMWELKPGLNGDPTNCWYPTIPGLTEALYSVGFTSIELIYKSPDKTRITVKAIK